MANGHHRMYPIVPPPADVAADVNLDVSHHELLEMDVAPDVLILPSRLKYFAKVSLLSRTSPNPI
jgi:DNA polymerase alpha subunit B